MPGSVDDPVRFGNPFQRIVEVHWTSREFIAFNVDISLTEIVANMAQSCPVETEPPVPGEFYADNYIATAEWGGDPPVTVTTAMEWDPEQEVWDSAPGTGAVTGFPPLPGLFTFQPVERSAPYLPRWIPSSGGGLSIPIPGDDSVHFDKQSSVQAFGVSNTYSDQSFCQEFEPGLLRTVWLQLGLGTHADMTLNLGGIVVVIEGKAYKQVGLKCRNVTDQSETQIGDGGEHFLDQLWILCRRAAELDP